MHDNFYDLTGVRGGSLYAGSIDHEEVEIWDADSKRLLCKIPKAFEGGASRFLIDPNGLRLFTGRWEGGVSCFDLKTTRRIWHRQDIQGVQQVRLSNPSGTSVFVAAETEDTRQHERNTFDGILELSAETGETIWSTTSGHGVFTIPGGVILIDRVDEIIRIIDEGKKPMAEIPMIHFAVCDVDARDSVIALAEGGKGVRVITRSGKILGRYRHPNRECNCVDVAFIQGEKRIFVHDNETGTSVAIIDLQGNLLHEYEGAWSGDMSFLHGGRTFVDSAGKLFHSITGHLVEGSQEGQHNFPDKYS